MFTVLILGILKILDGKDIAPILVGIAGYILSKSTSGTKQEKPTGGASASDNK